MAGVRPRTRRWAHLRLAVLDRDGWRCQIRGPGCTLTATTVDHVLALAEGGDVWSPANLRAACLRCNCRLGAELVGNRRGGDFRYRTTLAPRDTRM